MIDLNIARVEPLDSPGRVREMLPLDSESKSFIIDSRNTVNAIIRGEDSRLLALVGPCSIHDPSAAVEYASRLKRVSAEINDQIFPVMRTYFEKPRTTVGWKGLILDPRMDGSYDISYGIREARSLLVRLTGMQVAVGCEVLDPIIPQYIDDLMCWSAIGARTTESQTHRNLASGLSVAVGFKNNTNGSVTAAINAILSAQEPAAFIGIDKDGLSSVFRTRGNPNCHLILRGGERGPNYSETDVKRAVRMMERKKLCPSVMIDCSHSNSQKDFRKQGGVLESVISQVCAGERGIRGFMLESNLVEGQQSITGTKDLVYGQSVTDSCIGWEETERMLRQTAALLREKRKSY